MGDEDQQDPLLLQLLRLLQIQVLQALLLPTLLVAETQERPTLPVVVEINEHADDEVQRRDGRGYQILTQLILSAPHLQVALLEELVCPNYRHMGQTR